MHGPFFYQILEFETCGAGIWEKKLNLGPSNIYIYTGWVKKGLLFKILRWHLPGNHLSYGAVLFRTWSTHEYINLRKGHLLRTNGSLVIATSFFGKVTFFLLKLYYRRGWGPKRSVFAICAVTWVRTCWATNFLLSCLCSKVTLTLFQSLIHSLWTSSASREFIELVPS